MTLVYVLIGLLFVLASALATDDYNGTGGDALPAVGRVLDRGLRHIEATRPY